MDRGTSDLCRDLGRGEHGCGGAGRRKTLWRFHSPCDAVGFSSTPGLGCSAPDGNCGDRSPPRATEHRPTRQCPGHHGEAALGSLSLSKRDWAGENAESGRKPFVQPRLSDCSSHGRPLTTGRFLVEQGGVSIVRGGFPSGSADHDLLCRRGLGFGL